MTDIVVASRAGILVGPDGVKYRLVAGKTLAHASHPAVVANPRIFTPMTIEIVDPALAEAAEADEQATELAGELHEARAEADRYREQLAGIADLVLTRGLPEHYGVDVEREGWLAEVVARLLAEGDQGEPDSSVPEQVTEATAPAAVPPPRGARKPAARRPAGD